MNHGTNTYEIQSTIITPDTITRTYRTQPQAAEPTTTVEPAAVVEAQEVTATVVQDESIVPAARIVEPKSEPGILAQIEASITGAFDAITDFLGSPIGQGILVIIVSIALVMAVVGILRYLHDRWLEEWIEGTSIRGFRRLKDKLQDR